MASAFNQLCPRYSGTLIPTVPTAISLWEIFSFTFNTILPILHFVPPPQKKKIIRRKFEDNGLYTKVIHLFIFDSMFLAVLLDANNYDQR